MADPKTINVFLASSIKMQDDRDKFGRFIGDLNDIYRKQNVCISYKDAQNIDKGYNGVDKQKEINQEYIRKSHIFIALFHKKLGKYTLEECDEAIDGAEKNGHPKVYAYFKLRRKHLIKPCRIRRFEKKIKEKLYWQAYKTIEDLKLQFLMDFMKMEDVPAMPIEVQDSEIKVDGISVAKIADMFFTKNNKNYQKLNETRNKIQCEVDSLKASLSEKYNEDTNIKLHKKLEELEDIERKIDGFEKSLLKMYQVINDVQGKNASARLQKAKKKFEAGDSIGADTILAIEKINEEADANMKKYLSAQAAVLSNIEEYRLKAKIIIAKYDNNNRTEEADNIYSTAIKLANYVNMSDKDYFDLIMEYGDFLYNYAFYDKALQIREECLRLSIKINGEEDQATAGCYNNLGAVYDDMGEYERALENHEKALKIYKKLLGENHPDTAKSYNNLGNVYYSKGDYERALENFGKSLKIRRKILGENHPDTAMSYNNLGTVYRNTGDYEKALENHEKALKIQRKLLGENHPDMATSYNNLGNVYYSKGDYDKALEYHEKDLEITRRLLGENHPDTATSYNNLGSVYAKKGDYVKASENFETALKIQRKVLGENHPNTAMSYNNLGGVYYSKGDFEKALENYEKALAIQRKVLGENHPDTAMSYGNLGILYKAIGKYKEAEQNYAIAASIFERALGPMHPYTCDTYWNLGLLYANYDEEKAAEYMVKAAEGGLPQAIAWLQMNGGINKY